jgi:hypothetical protein
LHDEPSRCDIERTLALLGRQTLECFLAWFWSFIGEAGRVIASLYGIDDAEAQQTREVLRL